ncbi:MAG: MerR family transcriptional regulator [Niameybacter sp.]
MENHTRLFTTSQFAKLHHINKRTLHYYDEIGLFSPSYKSEKGYRYYTYLQSPILEMVLAFRELGMSIEEISQYMQNRSQPAFRQIIDTKMAEIDQMMKQLRGIRKLLVEKEKHLALCEGLDLDQIDFVTYPEEYLLISQPITGAYDDQDLRVLIEHAQSVPDYRLYNKSYGSMIAVEDLLKENFEANECLFTKIAKSTQKADYRLKPKGRYIRAFCKGNWDKLPDTYRRLLDFAKAQDVKLTGYAYEEGINEMVISSMEEYVTQITILCEGE